MTQRSRLDLLVRWEIDVIDRFLHEGVPFFERRAKEAGGPESEWLTPDGRLTEPQSLLRCRQLVLEFVLQYLNSLVDAILLALLWRVREDPDPIEQARNQTLSRASVVRTLESHYKVHFRFIRGWHIVEKLREESNALKHRAGLTLVPDEALGLNQLFGVRPSVPEIEEDIGVIRDWLLAVISATEGSGSA